MDTTKALRQLLERCKYGIYLTVNEHRNYYETAQQRLDWHDGLECPPEIAPDVRDGILQTGDIFDLVFYPDTSIGSYHLVHYDLDMLLSKALEALGE